MGLAKRIIPCLDVAEGRGCARVARWIEMLARALLEFAAEVSEVAIRAAETTKLDSKAKPRKASP